MCLAKMKIRRFRCDCNLPYNLIAEALQRCPIDSIACIKFGEAQVAAPSCKHSGKRAAHSDGILHYEQCTCRGLKSADSRTRSDRLTCSPSAAFIWDPSPCCRAPQPGRLPLLLPPPPNQPTSDNAERHYSSPDVSTRSQRIPWRICLPTPDAPWRSVADVELRLDSTRLFSGGRPESRHWRSTP